VWVLASQGESHETGGAWRDGDGLWKRVEEEVAAGKVGAGAIVEVEQGCRLIRSMTPRGN
jgi:hypothetical protein